MKYELPKSYVKRAATNTSPPSIMSHPNPRPPADFRPRPARSTAPSPLSTPSPHAVERARTQPSPTTPPSFPSPRHSGTTPVSASTYQQLLVELRSRQQENEHLRHLTQQLLNDVSVLQAKYAQAIVSGAPTGHQLSALGQPSALGQTDVRESLLPLAASPSSPQVSQPPVARQAIRKALATLSVFERPSPPHRKQDAPPKPDRRGTPLPELSILNRLRQTKPPKSAIHQGVIPVEFNSSEQALPEQALPELSTSELPSSDPQAIAAANTSLPSPESPSPSSSQPKHHSGVDRTGVDHRSKAADSPARLLVSPLVEDERILDYDYASPYQKARQEQAQATPLWIWLLAWLLLLPISAGLGYTFVQWVMNPGAPSHSQPPIEQAE
ncbi:MAG: hypothetical protein AAGJ55_04695 [Cyanobacteria bacterium J06555_12]